jgi:hypothetical protein
MFQAACPWNATQRPDRHRIAILAGDDNPILVIGMCPDLVRAALAHHVPAGIR